MDRTRPMLNQLNIVSGNIWQAVFMGFSPLLGNVSGTQKVLPEMPPGRANGGQQDRPPLTTCLANLSSR